MLLHLFGHLRHLIPEANQNHHVHIHQSVIGHLDADALRHAFHAQILRHIRPDAGGESRHAVHFADSGGHDPVEHIGRDANIPLAAAGNHISLFRHNPYLPG